MSNESLTFKTGVCRDCKAEWDLDRTYVKAEIMGALNELAHCPECKSIHCSFPYATGTAPSRPIAVEADASFLTLNSTTPDPAKAASPPKPKPSPSIIADDEPF